MPPETSDRESFAVLPGKKRQGKNGKKGENGEEKKDNCKIVKGEDGKLKWKEGRKSWKMSRGSFFFFFFFSLFTFQNDENLFWG